MKENYERWMAREIQRRQAQGETPSLLLHSCCAPCSSAVLESLARHFKITVFYYNPNISPQEEYSHRVREQKRFLSQFPPAASVSFLEGAYQPERFFQIAKGLEQEPEGGARCALCYELRLRQTAQLAKEMGFDYFTTTLSISPYKDAEKLNAIGRRLSQEYSVDYLFSDFKKKGRYQRSIALSREYSLYRQEFCGCPFSQEEARQRKEESAGGKNGS